MDMVVAERAVVEDERPGGRRAGAWFAGNARTPTWPARTARTALAFGAQIDHVLVSRDFAARRARFLDLDDTDHCAVVVDLTLHRRG